MSLTLKVHLDQTYEAEVTLSANLAQSLCDAWTDRNCVTHSNGTDHITHEFSRQNLVPDVDRYRVTRHPPQQGCAVRIRDGWYLVAHPRSDIECCPYNDRRISAADRDFESTIVVVLESPHKFEYLNRDPSKPIAPACGVSGIKVQDVLLDMLIDNSADFVDNTRVIVANPVPFQASLGSLYNQSALSADRRGRIKRKVWQALWSISPISQDFLNRMSSYCPNITINACTCTGQPDLQDIVSRDLLNPDLEHTLYETSHPSAPGGWTERHHCMQLRPAPE